MNRPPDRGRGRGRGNAPRPQKVKITHADIEAYLKAKAAEFPALGEVPTIQENTSKDYVQVEQLFKTNPLADQILILDQQDEQFLADPWEIKSRYLPHVGYPESERIPRYIYEAMLIETGSIEITYHHEKATNKHSPIQYSKAIVRRS